MKNRLQIILLIGILSSCSIYNYKTIDIPKETFKPPFVDIGTSSLVLKETKFYIHDTKNEKFIAETGILKDSIFKLMNFKKLTFKKYAIRNNRAVDISKDETHLFLNKGVNPQSNNQSITIQTSEIDSIHKFQRRRVPKNEFILRKRAKSSLFDPKGFSKNTDKWKFYIQDIDDSTFECRNFGIYDSTISATLIPKRIEKTIMLNEQNLIRKNEVYLKINLSCTNKNSQIYLQPKNIIDMESYMNQKDLNLRKGDTAAKIIYPILTIAMSAVFVLVLAIFIVIISFFA